ncbi:NAD-dependent epimerase/dehydratase family protein [Photorhabdus heterorhabditis]|uniref:NAD-dependent epimerase/dehydratase family protein n=1 Tax=Photorhabdus heterorhabditis TaxID=880156 RepID=UPI0015621C71|nr:NAD-dependent epimerase/dehydratase family protein [Photorhabdus heterorhabditis]NRN27050.1 NAD-dependent epimerase/dehydratase family protein [Photorhabdus heterorhabditis subsp. aluminescens]
MKSITVVGADGFIGNAIVKGLSQNGYNPVAVTRSTKIENYGTDIVFYVAGSSTPHNAADDTTHVESDLRSLFQLLTELKKLKTRPLFVFFSSAGTVYDPSCPQPYNESSPLSPTNFYGCGKLAQEAVVRQSEWVESLILRLSNIYGPHQKPKPGFGVIAHWTRKVCSHEPIEIMGNSWRDYLNISDLVDIVLKIVNSPPSCYAGLTVNVGSGNTINLEELYEIFRKAADRPIDVIKKPAREFDTKSVSINISLAKELFNWRSKIPLDVGIKEVLEAAFASMNKNIK